MLLAWREVLRVALADMEDLRIEPRRATAQELQSILVAVRCGVASPQVTTLLGHIAALVEERDMLQRQLDIANERLDIAWGRGDEPSEDDE